MLLLALGGSSPVWYIEKTVMAEGHVSFFCIMHESCNSLSDSNLLNLNLGMKILLSKSAIMLAFLLTSSVELTETWITVNNILQIVNHVYNLGWEVMLWDTAICLLFVTANFFAHEQQRGCFFFLRAKLQFSITDMGKCWLLMLNQITFAC